MSIAPVGLTDARCPRRKPSPTEVGRASQWNLPNASSGRSCATSADQSPRALPHTSAGGYLQRGSGAVINPLPEKRARSAAAFGKVRPVAAHHRRDGVGGWQSRRRRRRGARPWPGCRHARRRAGQAATRGDRPRRPARRRGRSSCRDRTGAEWRTGGPHGTTTTRRAVDHPCAGRQKRLDQRRTVGAEGGGIERTARTAWSKRRGGWDTVGAAGRTSGRRPRLVLEVPIWTKPSFFVRCSPSAVAFSISARGPETSAISDVIRRGRCPALTFRGQPGPCRCRRHGRSSIARRRRIVLPAASTASTNAKGGNICAQSPGRCGRDIRCKACVSPRDRRRASAETSSVSNGRTEEDVCSWCLTISSANAMVLRAVSGLAGTPAAGYNAMQNLTRRRWRHGRCGW